MKLEERKQNSQSKEKEDKIGEMRKEFADQIQKLEYHYDQELRKILSQYLFDPIIDKTLMIKHASGGQKARLQIIKMLINNPNIIILDEPTNHLDLPSIEEIEKSLLNYEGTIIYVSHDKQFVEKIGGEVLTFGV